MPLAPWTRVSWPAIVPQVSTSAPAETDTSPPVGAPAAAEANEAEQVPADPQLDPEAEPEGDPQPVEPAPAPAPGETEPELAPEHVAEPDEDEVEPQPSGKLVFQCRKCGTWNDLIHQDVAATAPLAHRRFATCEGCGGIGKVDTGSFVTGLGVIACPDCNGQGFLDASTGAPAALPDEHGEPPWPGAEYVEGFGWK